MTRASPYRTLESVNRWRLAIALYAGVFILANAMVWVAAYPTWRDLRHLTHTGVQTEGTVTGKEPHNHQGVRYAFAVGDLRITGIGGAGRGGLPSLGQIDVGRVIPVTYLPDEPTVSVPGNPADLYESWSALLFLVAPVFGLIAASLTLFRLEQHWAATRLRTIHDKSKVSL
ncbi:MAG: hypothetical protein U1G08_05610 [Verrucomicrobiota bacterium]